MGNKLFPFLYLFSFTCTVLSLRTIIPKHCMYVNQMKKSKYLLQNYNTNYKTKLFESGVIKDFNQPQLPKQQLRKFDSIFQKIKTIKQFIQKIIYWFKSTWLKKTIEPKVIEKKDDSLSTDTITLGAVGDVNSYDNTKDSELLSGEKLVMAKQTIQMKLKEIKNMEKTKQFVKNDQTSSSYSLESALTPIEVGPSDPHATFDIPTREFQMNDIINQFQLPSTSNSTVSPSQTSPLSKIKSAGISGIISYIITEVSFWFIFPFTIYLYDMTTTHQLPNLKDPDEMSKYIGLSVTFLTIARVAVPGRIALALSITPWVEENITNKYLKSSTSSSFLTNGINSLNETIRN